MLGDFSYVNPTKLCFGEDALSHLHEELSNYGNRILLIYGGGSIKKSGVYDAACEILQVSGKEIYEDDGVMSDPTVEKLREGCDTARKNQMDFILVVGDNSVCDYVRIVSVSIHYEEDPWERYYLRMGDVPCEIVLVGCIFTMVRTGSEMNGGAVITNHEQKLRIGHVLGEDVFPKFVILNPTYTYFLPKYQMVSGICDILSHTCEQYFSGEDDNTSDYISEGLLRSILHFSYAAIKNPRDYEARSDTTWTATWVLNTLIAKGKTTDRMVHMLGQAVGACTDATHSMTPTAVSMAYYRLLCPYGLSKFVRFAQNVWNVNPHGKTPAEIVAGGLDRMEQWMKDLGLIMHLTEFGVREDMMQDFADATLFMEGSYKILNRDEILQIFKESM